MIRSYKDLNIWNKATDLVMEIYKITKSFPKDETYGLVVQMRRSAISIPSNISEGFVRQYNKEYKQFLYIALGSCAELDTQLIIVEKLKYLDKGELEGIQNETDILARMIMSLVKKL